MRELEVEQPARRRERGGAPVAAERSRRDLDERAALNRLLEARRGDPESPDCVPGDPARPEDRACAAARARTPAGRPAAVRKLDEQEPVAAEREPAELGGLDFGQPREVDLGSSEHAEPNAVLFERAAQFGDRGADTLRAVRVVVANVSALRQPPPPRPRRWDWPARPPPSTSSRHRRRPARSACGRSITHSRRRAVDLLVLHVSQPVAGGVARVVATRRGSGGARLASRRRSPEESRRAARRVLAAESARTAASTVVVGLAGARSGLALEVARLRRVVAAARPGLVHLHSATAVSRAGCWCEGACRALPASCVVVLGASLGPRCGLLGSESLALDGRGDLRERGAETPASRRGCSRRDCG